MAKFKVGDTVYALKGHQLIKTTIKDVFLNNIQSNRYFVDVGWKDEDELYTTINEAVNMFLALVR